MSRAEDIEALEDMVERMGASGVVDLLEDVCKNFASDARDDGDDELADEWDGMATALSDIDWEGE